MWHTFSSTSIQITHQINDWFKTMSLIPASPRNLYLTLSLWHFCVIRRRTNMEARRETDEGWHMTKVVAKVTCRRPTRDVKAARPLTSRVTRRPRKRRGPTLIFLSSCRRRLRGNRPRGNLCWVDLPVIGCSDSTAGKCQQIINRYEASAVCVDQ